METKKKKKIKKNKIRKYKRANIESDDDTKRINSIHKIKINDKKEILEDSENDNEVHEDNKKDIYIYTDNQKRKYFYNYHKI